MTLDRPILVTGTPRSGKTLVGAILGRSPEVLSLEEPLLTWDGGLPSRSDDCRNAADATEQAKQTIRRLCETQLATAGKTRYVDNLAYHALRIPFVHAVMPEARIIHVIKNGEDSIPELHYGWTYRDTIARVVSRRRSQMNWRALPRYVVRFANNYVRSRLQGRRATFGPRVPGMADFARTHSPAEIAAFQWVQMVRIALDDLADIPRDQQLEVRYDKLMADPTAEARRIADFAEVLDAGAVVEHAKKFIDPTFLHEKRVEPSQEDWARVRPLIRPIQVRLGYESA